MSRSNWIYAITIGLTLLCQATLLLGQENFTAPLKSDPIAKPGQEKAAATGKTSTTKKVESPPDPSPVLEGIESAIRDLIPKVDKIEREWEKQQNIADLQAQKDMAFWAKLMVWATVCTVGITFIGIVLIWRTLHHSRRAADAAKEMVTEARATTKAAQDTVVEGRKATAAANRSAQETIKVTREIGEAQNRAYVGIAGFKAFIRNVDGKLTFRYEITVKNAGQSPALGVEYDMQILSNAFDNIRNMRPMIGAKRDLIPGASFIIRCDPEINISAPDWKGSASITINFGVKFHTIYPQLTDEPEAIFAVYTAAIFDRHLSEGDNPVPLMNLGAAPPEFYRDRGDEDGVC